jgi:hypothetical protein
MSTHEKPLGRRPPSDFRHLERYRLTPTTVPDKPTPVVLGINWWSAFDSPRELNVSGGKTYWIGMEDDWGHVRGGHAICVKPAALKDSDNWWTRYDQGNEGACVGFAASRMMTLLNRKLYAAGWLYHEAQKNDEWPGEDYDGTSVRAGMDILRNEGHRRVWGPFTMPVNATAGIEANRWASSVTEVLSCLHEDGSSGYVTLVNSWGRSYPHFVRLPLSALDRLLKDDGEATIVTDR